MLRHHQVSEDPVYFTLVPQPSFAARRTTMLVFSRAANGTVERLAVNRYPLGAPYSSAWSGGDLDAQWNALGALIESRNPKRIGIDVSRSWPAADGLTQGPTPETGDWPLHRDTGYAVEGNVALSLSEWPRQRVQRGVSRTRRRRFSKSVRRLRLLDRIALQLFER